MEINQGTNAMNANSAEWHRALNEAVMAKSLNTLIIFKNYHEKRA